MEDFLTAQSTASVSVWNAVARLLRGSVLSRNGLSGTNPLLPIVSSHPVLLLSHVSTSLIYTIDTSPPGFSCHFSLALCTSLCHSLKKDPYLLLSEEVFTFEYPSAATPPGHVGLHKVLLLLVAVTRRPGASLFGSQSVPILTPCRAQSRPMGPRSAGHSLRYNTGISKSWLSN